MKTWQKTTQAYIEDHLNKTLIAPNIRLVALKNIENAIRNRNPELLKGDEIFLKFNKETFLDFYTLLKGTHLNSAEKSVINGLYKFCK